MQKTCSPDVATESSLAPFKIPKILYSGGIWQVPSQTAAARACQRSVGKGFQVIFLTNVLMFVHLFRTYRGSHIPPPSCARSCSFSFFNSNIKFVLCLTRKVGSRELCKEQIKFILRRFVSLVKAFVFPL